jgi:hypothetical protein
VLEVLVFLYSSQTALEDGQVRLEHIDDPRFVRLVVEDRLTNWEKAARGGEDYWVVASALVKKRRGGGT